MTKDEERTEETTLEFPRYHNSHSIVYRETVVYCMFCKATRERLYEPCPQAVGFGLKPKEEEK